MRASSMHRALAAIAAAFCMVMLTVPAAFEALDRRFPPPLHRGADTSFEVTDREGRLLRAFANKDGRWRLRLELDDIDPRFIELLLAYEDKRFREHSGVDPLALGRALWQCVRYRRIVSGGSTITMQLARLIEPGERRAFATKLVQIFRALQIERRLDKAEILRLYLTLAPYGGNLEGLRAASLAYFGREPKHLPPAIAAMLVALPQAPESRRPDRHSAEARAARDRVLSRLVEAGALDLRVAEAAMAEPAPEDRGEMPASAPHLARMLASTSPSAHFARTTLDARLQRRLEVLARDHAERLGPRISTAILVADAEYGEVLAHIGSPDAFDAGRLGAVDMTRRARSPGSTLKPLIYAIGFEDGIIAPDTMIEDRPSHFSDYAPENFDRSFQGTVTVSEALASSLNVPAIAVLDAIGPQRLLARLRRAGAAPVLAPGGAAGLAIGLGGIGLTLHDLVSLYAALAREGRPVTLRHLPSEADEPDVRDRVISASSAYRLREILRTVPPPEAAAGGRIAFKTGTSYGYRDAWSIGYDGRHVIGVWVGRADGVPVHGLTGRAAAAPLLFDAFARISAQRAPFAPPSAEMANGAKELPHALRYFRPPAAGSAPGRGSPLVLAFPPHGARLDRTGAKPDQQLVLKAEGGVLPLAWFANGQPVTASHHRRAALWTPDGPGFASLSVVDATGASARARIFIDTSH